MFTTDELYNKKIQLTEEENNIFIDMFKQTNLSYIMLYFHLLRKIINIKYVNLSDENTAILLNLLQRLPVGFDMDGDAVVVTINHSRQRATIMYATSTIAKYMKEA